MPIGQITKRHAGDLAVLGGAPAFSEPLCVGKPNVPNRAAFLQAINEMLDRKWLTNNGPYVRQFEQRIAQEVGVKHCIAMCNGTIALEIAARALGLSGEVIVPAFTFVATAHALQWQQITPVFADVDPKTHNIDPEKLEQLITPRTSGIIGVHVCGRPCPVEALKEIAQKHRLRLLFDAAHAFGCSYKGRLIGGFGDAEIFSFHATKFIHTFEGGAVVTNNDIAASKMRLMRNNGFVDLDEVAHVGTNGKMSEVAAAMGLSNLDSVDHLIEVNRRNYETYREQLEDIPGMTLIPYDSNQRCNYQYVVVEVDQQKTKLSRDQLVEVLNAENVVARRYFFPGCHRMEPYRSLDPDAGNRLPNTEQLAQRVIVFPTGTGTSQQDIATIGQILRTAVHHVGRLGSRFVKRRDGIDHSTTDELNAA